MNIHQCARAAQLSGKDRVKFTLSVTSKYEPTIKPITCVWLDPWMELLQIEGREGFTTLNEVDSLIPNAECEIIE